jgi:cbb3-type cytochrome oxidase subunit 3
MAGFLSTIFVIVLIVAFCVGVYYTIKYAIKGAKAELRKALNDEDERIRKKGEMNDRR